MLWFKMPKNLDFSNLPKGITPVQCVAIMANIGYFANSQTGLSSVRLSSLCTQLGIKNVRSCRQVVDKLMTSYVQVGDKSQGALTQYYYIFNWNTLEVDDKLVTSEGQVSDKLVSTLTIDKNRIDKSRDNNIIINNNIIEHECDKNEPKFNFEYAYNLYPKKMGKTKGMQSCRAKIKSQKKYDDLILAITNYKKLTNGTDKKYVKQFSTFMNCWEDYLDNEEVNEMSEINEFAAFNLRD